nr:Pentatricopeptide repeat-containing protein [Ipomoea batatas]
MGVYKHNNELFPERRGIAVVVSKSLDSRRSRRLSRVSKRSLLLWVLLLAVLFSIYLIVFGLKMHSHDGLQDSHSSWLEIQDEISAFNTSEPRKKPRRQKFFPCEVALRDSVHYLINPEDSINFTYFSLDYIQREDKTSWNGAFEHRFGGHQTLDEREKSFYATNKTIHCGFVKGGEGFPSTGFDLDEKDKRYMSTCRVVVSSCIFGSSDFLRRPTSKLISEYSKKNVCFVMFVDKGTLSKLSAEGHVTDEEGNIGLWKIVVVKNLPYRDMRKTGKVPKFLSHRLFPSSRYSIWLDSKLRLTTDPMRIIDHFLWKTGSEYAISNHYTRHCVWEEVVQNKRLNKYNHSAIDEQFNLYKADDVPEGSFIVRAHTPMSNLFSCLWFNEVDRFTSRDQLSFAYTFLKLKRMNPDKPFRLHMFKVTREVISPQGTVASSMMSQRLRVLRTVTEVLHRSLFLYSFATASENFEDSLGGLIVEAVQFP